MVLGFRRGQLSTKPANKEGVKGEQEGYGSLFFPRVWKNAPGTGKSIGHAIPEWASKIPGYDK